MSYLSSTRTLSNLSISNRDVIKSTTKTERGLGFERPTVKAERLKNIRVLILIAVFSILCKFPIFLTSFNFSSNRCKCL